MRPALLAVLLLPLAACNKPPETPPLPNPPEEPQTHTGLSDAIQAPQDRARAVEQDVQEAARKRREQAEDQGG